MTTAHVFIATSLDGFIAREDGAIDWLLQDPAPEEDFGYDDFIASMETIVMGRGTYEKVVTFETWPYDLPVLVLSRQLAGTPVPAQLEGKVRFSNLAPQQVLESLSRRNVRRIYVDGGQLIQSFLREGLVSDLVVTSIPVLIGTGRRLFGALPGDVDLKLVASRSFAISGYVQSTYQVLG
ncbi:dihydrofolate reductase family protein [Pseudomonas chlororaphis]|uniref:Deaminase n=1 Tax=Pseudomonas chlororaphis TaxID=587753 RepID=A0A1Q8ENQ4_9PSED|nr:dihydrofolate reductase family protein [Pseudomonas chlororaphis]OLF53411.1 deaminase [Pseudomonas chlororaphis]